MTNATKQLTEEDSSNDEPKLMCVGECGVEVPIFCALCDKCKEAIDLFNESEFDIGN